MTIVNQLRSAAPSSLSAWDVGFVCIGSDRATGDCLGPMVGTFLSQLGYPYVYGTLASPVHALNLSSVDFQPDLFLVAIDACLARSSQKVGTIDIFKGPLIPGSGLDKDLSPVGDLSIRGFVAEHHGVPMIDLLILKDVRLSLVWSLAHQITEAIAQVIEPVPQSFSSSMTTYLQLRYNFS